jgi:hypothetical protein
MPSTRDRVPSHTSEDINQQIQAEIEESIRYFQKNKAWIPDRLKQLEAEWDIERAIEANASAIALSGILLGAAHDRRWLILPALVTAFLFQHAIQGWCPPIPVLRRLGFRTSYEIEEERQALKAIRGDFEGLSRSKASSKAIKRATRA